MNTKFFKRINKPVLKSGAALLIATSGSVALLPSSNFAFPVNPTLCAEETTNQDKGFEKEFREGRDLIDREEWKQAAAKFNEIIAKYPDNKSSDAALYWLAFCHKKQKQYNESNAALDRLLKDFPASSWVDDAKVMKLEIGRPIGVIYAPSATTVSPAIPNGIYSPVQPAEAIKNIPAASLPTYNKSVALGEIFTAASPTKLDREDEIKLAAFQSLLSADPKRAIETVGDILKSDSKASESFKQEVLRAFRAPRLSRAQGMNVFTSGIDNQFVPLLKETLVKSFQKESNVKIRKEIIYAIANLNDEQSANLLAQLYGSENDVEIKKAIINSFSSSSQYLFEANSNLTPTRKIAFDKLMDIIWNEKNVELRRAAFTNLQRFTNWSANEQTAEMLSKLYDGETSEEFKISIIQTLSKMKQNQASKKLLEIARNEKSDKLKLEAIYALRTSKNPEVLKFLEELIK
jgi:tetratricopeptide (TPR) repeat protein